MHARLLLVSTTTRTLTHSLTRTTPVPLYTDAPVRYFLLSDIVKEDRELRERLQQDRLVCLCVCVCGLCVRACFRMWVRLFALCESIQQNSVVLLPLFFISLLASRALKFPGESK